MFACKAGKGEKKPSWKKNLPGKLHVVLETVLIRRPPGSADLTLETTQKQARFEKNAMSMQKVLLF